MPVDRRPPKERQRARAFRDLDPQPNPGRRIERMWALVLRRFRDHLHSTSPEGSADSADSLDQYTAKDDDERQ